MPALQILRGMFSMRDEIIRRSTTTPTQNPDGSVTVKFNDLQCTSSQDQLVLTLDNTYDNGSWEFYSVEYNLWQVTFTKDTISILRKTGTDVERPNDVTKVVLKITKDAIQGSYPFFTPNGYIDVDLTTERTETMMEEFINVIKPTMPFLQDLEQDIKNAPHIHGLFNKHTPMVPELTSIIQSYII
jgi:hypothetical protein